MAIEYAMDGALDTEFGAFYDELLNSGGSTEFHLFDQNVQLKVVYKFKMDANDQVVAAGGPLVAIKKVSGHFVPLLDGTTHVVVVDKHPWDGGQQSRKKAALHNALMSIVVIQDDSGNIKVKARKPDIVCYRETVRRYGPWSESLELLAASLARGTAQLVEQINQSQAA